MLNRFKKARMIKGFRQKELANILGVSSVAVSNWESGKTLPNIKRLKQVADVLDTTVEELLNDPERRTG